VPIKIASRSYRIVAILVSLASLVFWVLGAAPAAMSPDSLESWRQIQVWEFWNGHPVVYTLWLWVTSFFGKSILLAAIIQEILLFGSVFFIFLKVLKGRDWSTALLLTGLLNFTPFIGQMGMTIWKDVPYVAFTLIGIAVYFSTFTNFKLRILGLVLFGFGALMRHDGILFALMLYVLLFSFGFRTIRHYNLSKVKIGTELVLSLILIYGLSTIMPTLLNATPVTQTQSTYPLVHDVAYIQATNPDELPYDVAKHIERIVSGDALVAAKNCGRVDDMAMSPGYNAPYIDQKPGLILDIWLGTLRSAALNELLYVHLCRAKAYLPGVLPETYVWTYLAIDKNNLGLEHFDSTSKFLSIAATWSAKWGSVGRGIAHPGTWALISFACLMFFRKMNAVVLIAVTAAGVIKNFQNILYTTGPYYRYGFLTQIVGIISLIVVFDYFSRVWSEKRKRHKTL
jgi:hypothetical protein